MESIFNKLNAVNVSDKTEQKNGLTYLSWAFAWGELKKNVPGANYKVYENANGLNYHHDGKTAWVKVGVTVNELEHIEYLPVMDHRNASIPLERLTSTDVNKAIQRAMTKGIARHGLGLYIYAGEDLPEGEDHAPKAEAPAKTAPKGIIEPAVKKSADASEQSVSGKLDSHAGPAEGTEWHNFKVKGHAMRFSSKDPAIVETLLNFGKLKKEVVLFFTHSQTEKSGKTYDNYYITRVMEPAPLPF